MILKTFLTETLPVACTTILILIFSAVRCSGTRENVLSLLCVLSYNVSHASHVYFLAIAVITL